MSGFFGIFLRGLLLAAVVHLSIMDGASGDTRVLCSVCATSADPLCLGIDYCVYRCLFTKAGPPTTFHWACHGRINWPDISSSANNRWLTSDEVDTVNQKGYMKPETLYAAYICDTDKCTKEKGFEAKSLPGGKGKGGRSIGGDRDGSETTKTSSASSFFQQKFGVRQSLLLLPLLPTLLRPFFLLPCSA